MGIHLPNELIDRIYSFVDDLGTLANLCLSSKSSCASARPYLYKGINLWHLPSDKVIKLLITILRNPKFGELILSLDISNDDSWPECSAENRETLWAEVQEARRPASRSVAIDIFANALPQDFEAFAPDDDTFTVVWIELLLISVPNLKTFHFTHPYVDDGFWWEFRNRYEQTGILNNITAISVAHHDTEGGYGLTEIISLVEMTQPTKLSLHACTGINIDEEDEATEPIKLSCLKELDMDHSCLYPHDWTTLVRWFPQLEVLKFSLGGATVNEAYEMVHPEAVGRAMLPLSKTLRVFEYNHFNGYDTHTLSPFESLRSFTKLESLSTSTDAITSIPDDGEYIPFLHKLPRGLHRLAFWPTPDLEMKRLAQIASVDFSELKEVYIMPELKNSTLQQTFESLDIGVTFD